MTKLSIVMRDGASVIVLPADLPFKAAAPLRDVLVRQVESGGAITVDAHAVRRISTAPAQVLAAAAKDAGCDLCVDSPSSAFSDTMADLGLTALFQQRTSRL